MSKIYTNIDGLRDMTSEEQAEYDLLKTPASKLRIIEDIAKDRGISFNKDDYSDGDRDWETCYSRATSFNAISRRSG